MKNIFSNVDMKKIWSFGNFLVVIPSEETLNVICYMNE